jgi:hypothetical protein
MPPKMTFSAELYEDMPQRSSILLRLQNIDSKFRDVNDNVIDGNSDP